MRSLVIQVITRARAEQSVAMGRERRPTKFKARKPPTSMSSASPEIASRRLRTQAIHGLKTPSLKSTDRSERISDEFERVRPSKT